MTEVYKVYKKTRQSVWEVSNYGNVKRNGEPYKCGIDRGYRYFSSHYSVHRAVAELFLPNPENKPEVDHIDANTLNNCVSNLRWMTHKENQNNPLSKHRHRIVMTNRKDMSKPVQQFTKDGTFVAEYPSANEAWRQTGIRQPSITQCCNGHPHYSHAGGFIWKWKV